MATRGTAILITNDLIKEGPEFNGDMYPHGHGDRFLIDLANDVSTESDFETLIENFNLENFNYEELTNGSYQYIQHTHGDLQNEENIITMENIYKNVSSDWVFVKNIASKSIKVQVVDDNTNGKRVLKNIQIRPGEAIRVYFGILKNDGKFHRLLKAS